MRLYDIKNYTTLCTYILKYKYQHNLSFYTPPSPPHTPTITPKKKNPVTILIDILENPSKFHLTFIKLYNTPIGFIDCDSKCVWIMRDYTKQCFISQTTVKYVSHLKSVFNTICNLNLAYLCKELDINIGKLRY